MSKRLIATAAGIILVVVVAFASLGPRVSSMFETAGASLTDGSAGGSLASHPAAPAASAAAPPGRASEAARSMNDAARGAGSSTAQAVAAQGAPAQVLPSLDRLIIRNVSLTLVVPNAADAYRQVEQIAAEQGGFIAGSQVRQEGDRTVASVTVRVPADSRTYLATLDRVRALADRVLDEQGQVQDVTEEHVDLEARVRNLRATETSLLALYDKAHRLEDVFAIQRELTNIRGQIEQAEGRKNALERRAALATISLQLREPAALAPRHREWSPVDVAAEALAAFAGALRGATTAAIWLVVWLPLYGLPLLALWLLRGRLRALVGPRPTGT